MSHNKIIDTVVETGKKIEASMPSFENFENNALATFRALKLEGKSQISVSENSTPPIKHRKLEDKSTFINYDLQTKLLGNGNRKDFTLIDDFNKSSSLNENKNQNENETKDFTLFSHDGLKKHNQEHFDPILDNQLSNKELGKYQI